jgi:hypothetical protein
MRLKRSGRVEGWESGRVGEWKVGRLEEGENGGMKIGRKVKSTSNFEPKAPCGYFLISIFKGGQ